MKKLLIVRKYPFGLIYYKMNQTRDEAREIDTPFDDKSLRTASN